MTAIRWGLIGAGWIATKAIAPAMHSAPNAIVQAVASRDSKRSQSLNPITIHKSYEALLNDPLVDAVYISLPNHLHCEWTVKALNAGKHVLCEKPFAMSVAEVETMVQAARDNNRILVEAVSSMWHPRMVRLVEHVRNGEIGELISIDSSFTFPAEIEGNYRNSPAMGGGALYDVGVYQLHVIAALIGDDAKVKIESCDKKMGPSGIDLTSKWQMRIDGTITATALASFELPENQSLIVRGTKQSIELVGNQAFTSWHSPSTLRLGENIEDFEAADSYALMIESFGNRVNGLDSWVLPLETSLTVAKMLGQLNGAHLK
jgi:predicted dehydrogenase